MGNEKQRRTQAERSAGTRAHILDTTFEALHELGYSGTSTAEVCRRGHISRGALLHHFPTKEALVAATAEHVLIRRLEGFRDAFMSVPAGTDQRTTAIELLWDIISGPAFYVWLELLIASRTDPVLNATVAQVGKQFSQTIRATYRELFEQRPGDEAAQELVPKFVFAVLTGLAVEHIIPDETGTKEIVRLLQTGTRRFFAQDD